MVYLSYCRKCSKSALICTLLVAVVLLPSCNRTGSTGISSGKPGTHKAEIFPRIRDYSPTTVPFLDNRAQIGTFHVNYEIEAPELVTKARLELYSNAVLLAWTDVAIAARGDADFKVEKAVAIGPTVKLQVQCPNGESNWMAIGGMRPTASSAHPRIENITPDSVPEENQLEATNGGADAPVQFAVWGAGFQPECKARFSVNNGEPMETRSVFWGTQQMFVYITRRPLYIRSAGRIGVTLNCRCWWRRKRRMQSLTSTWIEKPTFTRFLSASKCTRYGRMPACCLRSAPLARGSHFRPSPWRCNLPDSLAIAFQLERATQGHCSA